MVNSFYWGEKKNHLDVIPVTHAQVGVVYRLHHQSAALSVAACEAVISVSVVVLLHSQQHDWRPLRHQLAQATDGQTLPLSVFLDADTARAA